MKQETTLKKRKYASTLLATLVFTGSAQISAYAGEQSSVAVPERTPTFIANRKAADCIPCYRKCERCWRGGTFASAQECKRRTCDRIGGNVLVGPVCGIRYVC
jgi:hypothetical protein